jgi:starch synthase (maltosyl-transferring)
MVLVALSLDPHHVQEAGIEVPLWEWGLPDSGALAAEDLVRNHRFTWVGKNQTVRLDPGEMPFCIWRIGPAA